MISIDNLKDTWDEKATQSLFSNLEILLPPLETSIFQVLLFSTTEPNNHGKVVPTSCDDYDYKITAVVGEDQSVNIQVFRNELNLGDLRRIGFFEKSKLNQPQYKSEAFEKGVFEIPMKLGQLQLKGLKTLIKTKTLVRLVHSPSHFTL